MDDQTHRLTIIVQSDKEYQQLLSQCKKLEQDYLQILNTLSENDQDILVRYITLCEELEYRYALLKFRTSNE